MLAGAKLRYLPILQHSIGHESPAEQGITASAFNQSGR